MQCTKLERAQASGSPIEIAEEFRHLTLQVIGEAILSLSPEESDRVFPHLYLPIMEEGNRRSLEPWRSYLPLPAWFRQRRNVRQLNAYIIGVCSSVRRLHLKLTLTSVLDMQGCCSRGGSGD